MKKVVALAFAVAVAVGTTNLLESAQARKLLVIGGGSERGGYYQVAVNVCKLVNEKLGGQGYDCKGQPAPGSVGNIKALSQGYLDFAVAQSDHNAQAYNGEKNWKGKPVKGLRSVFSLYPETVMLVARADTGITAVTDLRGKRVNIGNPGSGTRENAEDVLRIYGIDRNDISGRELEPKEAAQALSRGGIDAFFYTVGNPWDGGIQLAKDTKIRMIPIDAPGIKKFVADHPYYVVAAIPGISHGIEEGVDLSSR